MPIIYQCDWTRFHLMTHVSMIMSMNATHFAVFLWYYNIVDGKTSSLDQMQIQHTGTGVRCFEPICPRMRTHIWSIRQVLIKYEYSIKHENKIQNNYRHLCKDWKKCPQQAHHNKANILSLNHVLHHNHIASHRIRLRLPHVISFPNELTACVCRCAICVRAIHLYNGVLNMNLI